MLWGIHSLIIYLQFYIVEYTYPCIICHQLANMIMIYKDNYGCKPTHEGSLYIMECQY